MADDVGFNIREYKRSARQIWTLKRGTEEKQIKIK